MQDRAIFSIFYVLSQKIWEIFTPLLPIKLLIILHANDNNNNNKYHKNNI